MALSNINQPDQQINFLTVIILNLMLAFSVLLVPKITSAFLSGGISNMAAGLGGAITGAAALTPVGILAKSKMLALKGASGAKNMLAKNDDEQNPSQQKAYGFHRYQSRRPPRK